MVKVLAQGVDPAKRPIRAACQNCGCQFEFERAEARFEADFRDGDALVIDCPGCGEEQWINVDVADRGGGC